MNRVRKLRNLRTMNFIVDCSEQKSLPLRRIVPLLVLVKEWGGMGKDAFNQMDIVLLLLQGIRAVDEEKVGVL